MMLVSLPIASVRDNGEECGHAFFSRFGSAEKPPSETKMTD